MHRSGPPADDGPGAWLPLPLTGAGRREFPGASAAALDPALRGYLADMVRPYGLTLRHELFERASGHSYGEMAGALLTETLPAGRQLDLLVLGFSMHDVIPGRSTAAYLSGLCPGNPLAFAICDAGAAAPFTALRVIADYARTGSCRRAALVVVEQATMHYEPAAPAAAPAANAAVALLFGESGSVRIGAVRQHADVARADALPLLVGQLAALAGRREDITVITGNGLASLAGWAAWPARLAGLAGDWRLRAAPPGQPCTGVCWELAGYLPQCAADGRLILLADYEPVLKYLCLTAIDVQRLAVTAPGGRTAAPTRHWPEPSSRPRSPG